MLISHVASLSRSAIVQTDPQTINVLCECFRSVYYFLFLFKRQAIFTLQNNVTDAQGINS